MKLNVDMAFENETGMEKKNWAIGFKPMGIGKKKTKKSSETIFIKINKREQNMNYLVAMLKYR